MIYLDFAAASPVSKKALKKMEPYFADLFFNPSAPYLPAKKVREDYENAKSDLAHTIGAKGNDLVITAGATESINLAFTAVNEDEKNISPNKTGNSTPSSKKSKVLYLATEHPAVREAASIFMHEEIAVTKTGLIDLKDFSTKLTDDVEFVSVSLANNELGTIQPLADISALIQKERQRRLKKGITTPLYFHSDASQALSLIDINVARLGVDLLTLNSAKVYGPKGIGALYVAHGVKLSPVVRGGGQERGLRSGTENVPAMIGFAEAAMEAKKHLGANRKKYAKLTDVLRTELKKANIEPLFLGNKKHQLTNFCPVSFPGVDAERLIYKLEEKEIYVSTGAACAASKGQKSRTLIAISLDEKEIAGSLRISLGALNDESQIKTAAREIVSLVNEMALPENDISTLKNAPTSKNISTSKNNKAQKTKDLSTRLEKTFDSTGNQTVFVGMSGGVDSSISAVLLKEQGYRVVGVYMKNWSKDLPGMKCPWAEDLADAKRVATKLGIEFKVFDFENEYKDKVVDYMLEEFKLGRTPNPDIMCNQEIKFKLFYDICREQGADYIATGHYAKTNCVAISSIRTKPGKKTELNSNTDNKNENPKLLRARDENKDQTYFLYRISSDAIAHTIFPLGDMLKPDVKKLAEKYGLHNAYKKESMGVCFVGDVSIKDFLKTYIKETPGKIIDIDTDEVLGAHEGAVFYTIGQRHGLNIGGGLPYYVVKKDMTKNIVYVSKNLNNTELWTKKVKLENIILRENIKDSDKVYVRLRHRAALVSAKINIKGKNQSTSINGKSTSIKDKNLDAKDQSLAAELHFDDEIKMPAAGQSAVIYTSENPENINPDTATICAGGGIITI